MANDQEASKPRAGLSLYANLLDPAAEDVPGTISRAPVVFKQGANTTPQDDDEASKKKLSAAALRFQPTKRPQPQKQKPKITFSAKPQLNTPPAASTAVVSDPANDASIKEDTTSSTLPPTSSVADWTNDADDDDYYAAQTVKRERGGRKKRKKNHKNANDTQERVAPDWDAIYDPSRPNNYGDYPHSDEHYAEIKEWYDVLHAFERHHDSDVSDQDEDDRSNTDYRNPSFAPPSFAPPSFAPPSNLNSEPPLSDAMDEEDDPYMQRMRMSQQQQQQQQQEPPPPPSPPPPPPSSPPLQSEGMSSSVALPPPSGTISRAPVRYNLPEPSITEDDVQEAAAEVADQADEPPAVEGTSNRPGKKGFAARIMAKYGWEKGQGLGASGTGIVTPLQAQVTKRKKLSDAEGGGFAGPAGQGKIVGGRKSAAVLAEEKARLTKFGEISQVVCLQGMLAGVNVADPEERAGVVEEIGYECGEKYGRVERVFIDTESHNVFVKFTAEPSALRALDALEGRIFHGNTITARFWNTERFEAGDYGNS